MTAVLSLLAVALPAVTNPISALAAPGDAFSVSRPTVFVAQSPTAGDNTRLFRSETAGAGTFAFTPEGNSSAGLYNAIGFNQADGFIYGVATGAIGTIPIRSLVRVGENGVVTRVGTSLLLPAIQFVGAFNPDDGLFYTTAGTTSNAPLNVINVQTGTIVRQPTLQSADQFADMEYLDGFFWAIDTQDKALLRINPTTGAITSLPAPLPDLADGSWGAAWKFGNGNLGFSHNTSGTILQLRITNAAAASPTVEVVATVPGPTSNGNDGTAIPGDPVDLAITKDVAPTFTPGGVVTYTLTVTNNGPGESSGWVVTDSIPSELTNIATGGAATCAVAGNEVTCAGGRLAVGASAQITITGTSVAAERGCFTNTASILGNELDPVAANDDDAAETCARYIEVTKETTGTQDSRAGDTVTYTVSATNTGAGSYTAADPAYVFDDLSGVLDDATYNADAGATQAGTITYANPLLSWSGALAAGATVEVEYTVTLTGDGDRQVRNVAWVPGEPENPVPPACDPATDAGTDPVTGEACAEAGFDRPSLSIAKVADQTEIPAVGDDITFTVTVTNTGDADYTAAAPATMTDDLTDVLDDATYNGNASATGGMVSYAAPTLSWSGPLAAGASVTITYTVTNTNTGDGTLHNEACVSTDEVVTGDAECAVVEIPLVSYTVTKEASSTTALPGDTVTYSVVVSNTGLVDYTEANPATFSDDLSAVLDDATYNGDVTAGGTVTSGTLTWAGPLAVGETVTVTYSVTVNDPATGDGVMTNAVIPDGPGGECAETCMTTTTVGSYSLEKTASTTVAYPGDVVTYTVAVTNTGEVAYTDAQPAGFSDDLAGVLASATYNGDASAGAVLTGSTLRWSGPLAVGETISVTYSVTVRPAGEGAGALVNAVTPTGPGGECDDACGTETPTQSFTVSKVASDVEALPGDVVTYTVTVTNSGQVAYTAGNVASFTDDLSAVLDDATYNDDATEGATVIGTTLSWGGLLEVGETVEITYSVTIRAFAAGDGRLINTVVPTGAGGGCDPDAACTTETLLRSVTVTKSTTATDVIPGSTIPYTLTLTNTGQVPFTDADPVSITDDLSEVLDDATYNADATSDADGTVTYAAPVLSWSGAIAPGATVTISYSVTVNDPATGDGRLVNAVVTPPGAGGNCEADSTDPSCIAVVPAAAFTVAKVASASEVVTGGTVTYNVTVANVGGVAYTEDEPAAFEDDLTEVLDDADYNNDATNGATVDGNTLSWSGPLAIGETITVAYSVTVDAPSAGDHVLRNWVLPTAPGGGCAPDGSCVAETGVASYGLAKTASAAAVNPGGTITYTITVTNTGTVAFSDEAPASFSDDLSGVLDDAAYNGDVTSGAVVTGDDLTWSGSLAVGEAVTVTYSVTVTDPVSGDGHLVNAVLPTAPGGDCGDACTTDTPVRSFLVTKTASAENVHPGDRVTYTVTVKNLSDGAYTTTEPASFTDDLSDVLDHAVYNGDATSGATVNGSTLSWSGALEPAATVTVTYSVTVGDRAPVTLRNVVVTPEGSGGNCFSGNGDGRCRTTTTVTPVPPLLAITGTVLPYAAGAAAVALLLAGVLLIARRRREQQA